MSVESPTPPPFLAPGAPCWVELAAFDEPSARTFYTGLFGWSYRQNPDPATGAYTLAWSGSVAAGGMYQATAGYQLPGWIPHLAVHNTTSAAQWVEHLGGHLRLGPVDIPGRGSILHITDPGGAPVVLWQPASTWEFGSGMPGTFAGADLNTHDTDSTDQFYGYLFDFTQTQIGDGQIDYAEWRLDQRPVLYRYRMGPEYRPDAPPHWLIHFAVDAARGTDTVAQHAVTLGGTVVTAPFDTPYGRTATLADPSGAVFSVIDPSRVVPDWGRAEVDDPYAD